MDELDLLEDKIPSIPEFRTSQEESISTVAAPSDVTTENEKIIETQVNTPTELIDIVPEDIIVNENPVEIKSATLNKSDEINRETDKN